MIKKNSKGKNQTRVSDKVEEFGSKGVKINPNSLSKDEKLISKYFIILKSKCIVKMSEQSWNLSFWTEA